MEREVQTGQCHNDRFGLSWHDGVRVDGVENRRVWEGSLYISRVRCLPRIRCIEEGPGNVEIIVTHICVKVQCNVSRSWFRGKF